MSTRATYQFPGATIYIHHDGYPAGAAVYFANMAVLGPRNGPENMIRANELAELTRSHDAHGDTEYRYTLDSDGSIKVQARSGAWENEKWVNQFFGTLADFINKHIAEGWEDEHKKRKFLMYGNACVTQEWLTAQAREKLAYAWHAIDKGWTGNASVSAGDACRMVKQGAQIPQAEIIATIKAACETCPHMVDYYLQQAA